MIYSALFPTDNQTQKLKNVNGKDLKLLILQLNDFITFNFDGALRKQINVAHSFA